MISIIIPTLNEERFLPLLLESLQRQTRRDFEVIVADAGSKDRTRDITLNFGCTITEGGTPARGRNCGARVAKGEWVVFLDADVILPHDFLDRAMNEMERRRLDIASPFIAPLNGRRIDKIFFGFYNWYSVITRPVYPHAPGFCIFVRRTLHEALDGFDEATLLAEDHDYVLKASRLGRFGLLRRIRVPVSMRRFEKDGHVNIALKYVAAEAHRIFLGPINSNIFRYRFGHYEESRCRRRDRGGS
ncbi:MAG: glycosyltransferase [Patescibacteria group bacterium]